MNKSESYIIPDPKTKVLALEDIDTSLTYSYAHYLNWLFDDRFYKGSKADKDVYTVLQPDLCVICDSQKLDIRGCIGAPDIVVEILSPGNNKKELLNKYSIYEAFCV